MKKNTQMELNNLLFAQLERLNDDEHMKENSEMELRRAREVSSVSKTIISNIQLAINAEKYKADYGLLNKEVPTLLQNE